MKKNIFTIVLILMVFNSAIISAQVVLKETSLKQQIEKSSLVVEGKVISKRCFWNNNVIYTANTLEVYKVFKGRRVSIIDVITKGGTVGLQALNVSSSLKLHKGDVGVFALEGLKEQNGSSKIANSQYKPYGAIQGFYKYNINADVAVNPFKTKKGISDSFYNEIMSYTKTSFTEVSSFNVKVMQSKAVQGKNVLAPSAIAFNPTAISAGTKSTITITIPGGNTGTDFGATKGKVAFSNADDGGATYINALNSQVTWSSTSITVEVPAEAGTGSIRVTNSDSTSIVSDTDLTVTHAENNVVYDEDDMTGSGGSNGPIEPKAFQIQHINENGSGGYTFQMHTDFNANTSAKEAFERAFEIWRCTTEINWTIGATTSVDVAEFESTPVQPPAMSAPSINVIRFDNGSELDTDVLGTCYSWYKGCSLGGGDFEWFVGELDVVFDDATDWNFGPGVTTASEEYDFESVALHELGHGHQLGHVIDVIANGDNLDDVMHYALQPSEDQRVLSADNIAAANAIQARSTGSIVCGRSLMTNYSGSCSLGLDANQLNAGIDVYPNPTTGEFYIFNHGLVSLQTVVVFDVSGRLILQQDISNTSGLIKLYLSGFSKGIYFVNIQSGHKTVTKKIVLE